MLLSPVAMLTALRSALVAMLLGLVLVSTGMAGAPDREPHFPCGQASLLTDAELEAISGGARECREDESGPCLTEPRVGPITRIILWDERVGTRVHRLSDRLDLAQRRMGGSARVDTVRSP